MPEPPQEEPINRDFSDGTAKNWPTAGSYRPANDYMVREKLAKLWREDSRERNDYVTYHINQLPSGYRVFETSKAGDPGVLYKRIFGHPSKKFFDSAVKFYPHFKWLMNGGLGACECILDSKKPTAGQPRRKREIEIIANNEGSGSDGASRFRARQLKPVDSGLYDEDGNPDVFKGLLKGLKTKRFIDVLRSKKGNANKPSDNDLPQKDSMDWVAERGSLATMLARYKLQPSFIPRVGELVLWVPTLEGDIVLDHDKGEYKVFDFDTKTFKGFPDWRAGTIADVPEDTIDYWDLSTVPKHSGHVSQTSGFRVETFPDPNDDVNKSYSKRYKYVRMRQIRPLSHWQLLLRGISSDKLHPSIYFALTVASSVSLVEKFSITGDMARMRATIYCQGLFLGPELLVTGDTIRFFNPVNPSHSNNILIICDIRLRLSGITPAVLDGSSKLLAPHSAIRLIGKALTLDESCAAIQEPVDPSDLIFYSSVKGIEDYGNWYRMHTPTQNIEISYDRVIGRVPEFSASRYWQGISQSSTDTDVPSLSWDKSSVQSARGYSQQADARIPDDKGWFWGDSRAETLCLETLNGVEIGDYSEMLKPDKREMTYKQWRGVLKIARGDAKDKDRADAGMPKKAQGRVQGNRVVDGKIVPPSKMVDAALESSSEESDSEDEAELWATTPLKAIDDFGTSERRRGRPPGSRLVDGKLVVPGRPVSVQKKEKSAARRESDRMEIDRPSPLAPSPASTSTSNQPAQPINTEQRLAGRRAVWNDSDDADMRMVDDELLQPLPRAHNESDEDLDEYQDNEEDQDEDEDEDAEEEEEEDPSALLSRFGGRIGAGS